jgi:hypothetical protein
MDADSDSDSDSGIAKTHEGWPAFADAEEYQEAVDESFTKLKRLVPDDLEEEGIKKKRKTRRQSKD